MQIDRQPSEHLDRYYKGRTINGQSGQIYDNHFFKASGALSLKNIFEIAKNASSQKMKVSASQQ